MAENINKKHKWRRGSAKVDGVMRTASKEVTSHSQHVRASPHCSEKPSGHRQSGVGTLSCVYRELVNTLKMTS